MAAAGPTDRRHPRARRAGADAAELLALPGPAVAWRRRFMSRCRTLSAVGVPARL